MIFPNLFFQILNLSCLSVSNLCPISKTDSTTKSSWNHTPSEARSMTVPLNLSQNCCPNDTSPELQASNLIFIFRDPSDYQSLLRAQLLQIFSRSDPARWSSCLQAVSSISNVSFRAIPEPQHLWHVHDNEICAPASTATRWDLCDSQ